MYQDTDFGKEVLDGARAAGREARSIKLVETTTHKPTDQDFTAPDHQAASAAGCDLVAHGHHRARLDRALRDGAQDRLDRRRSSSARPRPTTSFVGAAQGMDEASTPWASPRCPTSTASVPTVKTFVRALQEASYNVDPNIGAVYGYVAADLTVTRALKNAGKDLTTRQLRQGPGSHQGLPRHLQRPGGHLRPEHPPGRELLVPGRGQGRPLGPRDRAARLLAGAAKTNDEARAGDRPGFSLAEAISPQSAAAAP